MNDDELGRLLRDRLQARLRNIEPSPELRHSVDRIGQSRIDRIRRAVGRMVRRRLLAVVPIPVAAVIAALIFLLGGSTVTPSFAVVTGPGDAVLVTINDLSGVAGANARLRQLHVPAVVVPMTTNCPNRVSLTYLGVRNQSVRLTRRPLSHGTMILLAARQTGPNKVEMAFGRIIGKPPACVSANGSGPGLPGSAEPPVHG